MCTITCEVGIIHINSLSAYLTYNEVSVRITITISITLNVLLQLLNVIIKLILLEAFLPQVEIIESGYRCILDPQLKHIVFTQGGSPR